MITSQETYNHTYNINVNTHQYYGSINDDQSRFHW